MSEQVATPPFKLILASSSAYRRALLARMGLPFEAISPHVDETAQVHEAPEPLVRRLAAAKAMAVFEAHPDAAVIGCDQVAECAGTILGKPGDAATALRQLRHMRGRTVVFHSALCLVTPVRQPVIEVVPTRVRFRAADDDELRRYIERDRPLDCAGSFRSESLGWALADAVASDDPNALIGLPLIRLGALLRAAGWRIP